MKLKNQNYSPLQESGNSWNFFPKTWQAFLIIVILIGLFFRFVNIDHKYYWTDEAFTSMIIAGYTQAEIVQKFSEKQIISVKDLQKFQYPNVEKTLMDTLKSATQDTHPPLYYVILRWWTQIFGDSIAVIRSFSAVVSILSFPAIYWLCLELFEVQMIGWIAVALLAISPFQVLYAQEARMYSLWTVFILLSSLALLRANRLQTKSSWLLYSLTLTLSFYTYLFTIFVAISHGIYMFVNERFRFNRKLLSYLTACLLTILLYLPWIITLFINWESFRKASSWLEGRGFNLLSLINILGNNISNSLVDFWFAYSYFPDLTFPHLKFGLIIKPFLLLVIGYSIYLLCCKTKRKVWLFVISLMMTTPLLLILRDMVNEAGSSTQARYLVPCYLGVQISIVYLLGSQISNTRINSWKKTAYKVVMVLLISLGILSCSVSSQAETWSNKYGHNERQAIAFINQSQTPLLIVDFFSPSLMLSLSHYLDSQVNIQLVSDSNQPQISDNFTDIFLLNTSKETRKYIQEIQNRKIVSVKKIPGLRKVEK